ncbi:MAG: hypothetical protein Fur0037_05360 [Planctomycetota bacterium]
MEILLAVLVAAAWLCCPLGIALPALRRPAAWFLVAAAAAVAAASALGPKERTLEITHTFAGYANSDLEPSAVHFPVDHATAQGWQWGVAFAAWAMPWAIFLLRIGARRPGPFLLPLLCAFSAAASWLGLQVLAAPAPVVQPFGIERFLFPAGLGMTILLARGRDSIPALLASLSIGVLAMRLPLALFSKLASDRAWGTALDVHSIVEFLNPLTQQQVLTEPGAADQQMLLIWCQQLIVMPALYMLSYTGIGIGLYLFHRHGPAAGE